MKSNQGLLLLMNLYISGALKKQEMQTSSTTQYLIQR